MRVPIRTMPYNRRPLPNLNAPAYRHLGAAGRCLPYSMGSSRTSPPPPSEPDLPPLQLTMSSSVFS